jgi:hypothetical protein
LDTTNQPTPQKQIEPTVDSSRYSSVFLVLRELAPSFYALVVGVLYAAGFFVLNAYLAKFGIFDIDFINPRYFIAGASFVIFLVCFFVFAGRAIVHASKWVQQEIEKLTKDRPSNFWSIIAGVHGFANVILACCLSAATFTSLAVDYAESIVFYAALGAGFIIGYPLDFTNLDVKYPRTSGIVMLTMKSFAVYTFFAYGGIGPTLIVFSIYFGIMLFINQVIDIFVRYRTTTDQIAFTGIYAVIFLLGAAITYGTLVFNQVSPKLGGARPQSISVVLSEETRRSLPIPVERHENKVLEGVLIHQTPSYTYISSSGHTIRLRDGDVVAIVSKPEPEKAVWDKFLPRTTTLPDASPNGAAPAQSLTAP